MVALLCFFLTLLASPFKSNSRLEAENAALRHQLMVLQRKVRGRVHLTNSDRAIMIIRPETGIATGLAITAGYQAVRLKLGQIWIEMLGSEDVQ
jgi:hypothetical protein